MFLRQYERISYNNYRNGNQRYKITYKSTMFWECDAMKSDELIEISQDRTVSVFGWNSKPSTQTNLKMEAVRSFSLLFSDDEDAHVAEVLNNV
jgi:hypothetical protein